MNILSPLNPAIPFVLVPVQIGHLSVNAEFWVGSSIAGTIGVAVYVVSNFSVESSVTGQLGVAIT